MMVSILGSKKLRGYVGSTAQFRNRTGPHNIACNTAENLPLEATFLLWLHLHGINFASDKDGNYSVVCLLWFVQI